MPRTNTHKPVSPEPFLKPLEAAKRLGRGRTFIYERIAEGAFPNAVKHGEGRFAQISIPESDITSYIERHKPWAPKGKAGRPRKVVPNG